MYSITFSIMDRKQKYFFRRAASFAEVALGGGDKVSTIQILRTGSWNHPVYGQFAVNIIDLEDFVRNFRENVRGVKLCVDVNHEGEHRAIGWFTDVYRDGEALFAVIDWTDEGVELITSKQYRYFSPELYFSFRDEETSQEIKNVLIGGGITNRPFFKGMQALQMSEPENAIAGEARKTFYFYNSDSMKKQFSEIVAAFSSLTKVNAAQLDEARLAFSELDSKEQDKAFSDMSSIEKKFSEDAPAEEAPADAAPATPPADEVTPPADAPTDAAPADEPPADAVTPQADAVQASETAKTAEAALFAETGLSLVQIKEMQRQFSDMESKQYKADLEKQVSTFCFSEANKAGTLLPKAKNTVVEFAAKIPKNLVAEFFEIIKSQNFVGKVVEFGEKGKSGEAAVFSVPSETPAGVERESFVLATIAKQFSEAKGIDLGAATLEAHKYIQANKIQ